MNDITLAYRLKTIDCFLSCIQWEGRAREAARPMRLIVYMKPMKTKKTSSPGNHHRRRRGRRRSSYSLSWHRCYWWAPADLHTFHLYQQRSEVSVCQKVRAQDPSSIRLSFLSFGLLAIPCHPSPWWCSRPSLYSAGDGSTKKTTPSRSKWTSQASEQKIYLLPRRHSIGSWASRIAIWRRSTWTIWLMCPKTDCI